MKQFFEEERIDKTYPIPKQESWKEKLADLIDSEVAECSHQENCYAQEIINYVAVIMEETEQRVKNEIREKVEKWFYTTDNNLEMSVLNELLELLKSSAKGDPS